MPENIYENNEIIEWTFIHFDTPFQTEILNKSVDIDVYKQEIKYKIFWLDFTFR